MPARDRNGAFTLIELLVVIAIIAILAAILFPVFAQAREKARATSCLSNVKQVSLGVLMYVQDYDETMCGERMGGGTGCVWPPPPRPNSGVVWTWRFAVMPYVGKSNLQASGGNIWVCPSMPPTWNDALKEVDDDPKANYGIPEDTFWGCYGDFGVHSYAMAAFERPAQLIMVGETRWSGPPVNSQFLSWDYPWMGFWHTGMGNWGMWDGHAKAMKAVATVKDLPEDCMWTHNVYGHDAHLTARNNAMYEYR
ncbi:MAG: DUF1559 domain-containing protein [Chthonomonadales bacterium]|nr:DUF1559 domain-containing protein [Chthonomonadales bacterium]